MPRRHFLRLAGAPDIAAAVVRRDTDASGRSIAVRPITWARCAIACGCMGLIIFCRRYSTIRPIGAALDFDAAAIYFRHADAFARRRRPQSASPAILLPCARR